MVPQEIFENPWKLHLMRNAGARSISWIMLIIILLLHVAALNKIIMSG